MDLIKCDDYEAAARDLLPQMAFDYIAGGSDDEITLRENRTAYDRWRLKPRMLAGIGTRDLSVTVLGQQFSMPIGVAPTAYHRLAHEQGELGTARGAGAVGALMCVSTAATYAIEEIKDAATGPLWFQLYCYKDRELTRSLVDRARDAGYQALVLTADVPYLGKRERDIRNRFTLPPGISMRNFDEFARAKFPIVDRDSALGVYITQKWDADLSWEIVDWLVNIAKMPVLIKGILCAEDTRLAAEHGAAGVVVSNHGGRQLDSSITSLDALPEVVEAARDTNLTVMVDGGIRRGTDVVKALALGAQMVFVGRPVIWGLAVNGDQGVIDVLTLLRNEFDLAMALVGAKNVAALNPSFVTRV